MQRTRSINERQILDKHGTYFEFPRSFIEFKGGKVAEGEGGAGEIDGKRTTRGFLVTLPWTNET